MANNNFELKVEVVRFNEKDVIATSGPQIITDDHLHVALGSELLQDNGHSIYPPSTTINDNEFYVFAINSDENDLEIDSNEDVYGHAYAWYNSNDNFWYTEGKSRSYYENNNISFPR